MSSTPSPRGAQEQTLDAGPGPGPGQGTYGPIPVHSIGPSWSPAELPGVRRPSSILSPYGQSQTPSPSNQELVIVPNNSISQATSEIGSSAYALTRVMSPNPNQANSMSLGTNHHLLLGFQGICGVCNLVTTDPALCANCGLYGHPVCIGIEQFQGYAFCHGCFQQVVGQYATILDLQQRQQWEQILSQQLINWRERARDALGASTSIGITVGGAAATAAGAAFAVAQGLVQGAHGAVTGTGARALPPPPVLDVSASRPLSLRRSNSTGNITSALAEPCPKCDLGQTRAAHTYRGSCRGLPASVYFGRRQASTSTNPAIEDQPPATDLARLTENTVPTGSVFNTPDRVLEETLAPVPQAPPRVFVPGSPQNALMPPNSFDSANSHTNQSFYGLRPESPPGALALEAGGTAAQSTGLAVTPYQAITVPELSEQLLLVIASNEELSRVVFALQDTVRNLEIQVSDLQLQLQWYDENWSREQAQHFDIGDGTPRDRIQGGAQDALLERWYGGETHAMPPRVFDLTAAEQVRQSGLDMIHDTAVAETRLSRDALSQLTAQNQVQPRTDATSGEFGITAVYGGQQVNEVQGGISNDVMLPTDDDMFTFLAGTQQSCTSAPQMPTGVFDTDSARSLRPQAQQSCTVPALPVGNASVAAPPGLSGSNASQTTLTHGELGMIMKSIQTFLNEVPKLELGDIATRATRLLAWKANFEQVLIPVGPTVRNWWRWCIQKAAEAHKRFLAATLQDRESVMPLDRMPQVWEQVDSWMRPKILEAVPGVIRELVNMRSRQGQIDDTHVILFWLVKQFGPGSIEEQIAVNNNIVNPHACANPKSAQSELIRWKENIRRLKELNMTPPALMLTYRAMESIFSAVFDKAEPQLHARWISLKNELGLPHRVDRHTLEKVYAFATAELGALALAGNSSQNPGMPLTDNQKLKQIQQDGNKKRAAAAKLQQHQQQQPQPTTAQQQPQPATGTAAAVTVDGVRKSATTAMWAKPCTDWTNNGTCSRGISCRFAHAGFPISDKRCITCGKPDHGSKECTAPGGVKIPTMMPAGMSTANARRRKLLLKAKAREPVEKVKAKVAVTKEKAKAKEPTRRVARPALKPLVMLRRLEPPLLELILHFHVIASVWIHGQMCT